MNKIRDFLEKYGNILEKNAINKEITDSPPQELHIELTYRCNTKCIICNLRYLNKPEEELTVAQWKAMISGSRLLKGIRYIVLSGGEPWLKEDLIELVLFLRGSFPETGILILSNLTDPALAMSNIEKIKTAIGLKNISLGSSMDGIGPAYDKMRGKKGGFDLLTQALQLISGRYPELYISLNFTLTTENCSQILPVYDWCSDKGYHVSFQVMVQKEETKKFRWKKAHIDTIHAQLDALIMKMADKIDPGTNNIMKHFLNEGILSSFMSVHYIEKYILEKKRFFPNCPCGEKYAMLDPYGNLYFCPVHKGRRAGNVAQEAFDGLWVSDQAREVKGFFNKKACHCWLTCTNGYMIGDAIGSGKGKALKECF